MVKSKVNHFDHGKFVFWPWSWSKCVFFGLISCQNLWLTISTMKNLDFGHGHGRNFYHMTIVISKFWPWSWSKIFDHMTMTPARRPYGQKIMVALPPPPNHFTAGAVLPGRQTSQINTDTVRELLKDLPHNERSSASVLSMMDNMPPLLSMMLPNARLPSQLTELSRPPMQQSGTPDQRPVLEDQRTVNQSSVKCSDESRSRTDKAPLDLSSILGSIGSIDKIASITDMLKSSNQTSSDNQNQSCNNQPTQSITRYVICFDVQ